MWHAGNVLDAVDGNVKIAHRTDRGVTAKTNAFEGRAAILANEKFRGVRIALQTGKMSIQCNNSEQEEAEEELEIGYVGDSLEIGFNIAYLQDALAALHVDTLQLAFGDANRSTLVTIPENPNFKYIVMPMRI